MINKSVLDKLKKTNKKIADIFSQLGDISDKQLEEILISIEKLKQDKFNHNIEVRKDKQELSKIEQTIKDNDKKVLRKKEKISNDLDVFGNDVQTSSKKLKTINQSADKLIEKTTTIKKETIGMLGLFQRKEIKNVYKFTFTNTSKITSKGIKLNQAIIKNITIGSGIQEESQSLENYDNAPKDLEQEKIKILKSISSKLELVTSENKETTKKEDKKENKSSIKEMLVGSALGVAAVTAAKKYGGKVLSGAKVLGSTVGKRIIPGAMTLWAAKSLYTHMSDGISDYKKYKASGNDSLATTSLVTGVVGSMGDLLQGVASWIPGPLGWILQGAGLLVGTLSDAYKNKEVNQVKDVSKKTIIQKDMDKKPSISKLDKDVEKIGGKFFVNNDYKKDNGKSLNHIKTIKEEKPIDQRDAINYLIKENERTLIESLNTKGKGIKLPKYEVDGKIKFEALPTKEIKVLEPKLPDNIQYESDMKKHSMTTLGGALGSQHTITSLYNVNRDVFKKGVSRAHKGIDIAAPPNTPIYAPSDGVINYRLNSPEKRKDGKPGKAGINTGFGQYAILSTNGYQVLFGHLNNYGIGKKGNGKNGEVLNVKRGDIIGYVGDTGESDGNHIHLQVSKSKNVTDVLQTGSDGKKKDLTIDPSIWLKSNIQETQPLEEKVVNDYRVPKLISTKEPTFDLWLLAGQETAINTNKELNKVIK